MNNDTSTTLRGTAGTLEDIELMKASLRDEIRKDETEIGEKWHSLFVTEAPTSRSGRIAYLMNTGMSVLDGAILGWKLYREFKRNPLFRWLR